MQRIFLFQRVAHAVLFIIIVYYYYYYTFFYEAVSVTKTVIFMRALKDRGVRSKLKLGGLWLSGALIHKKRAPSSKFIYGGYTTQLSLKLLISECL